MNINNVLTGSQLTEIRIQLELGYVFIIIPTTEEIASTIINFLIQQGMDNNIPLSTVVKTYLAKPIGLGLIVQKGYPLKYSDRDYTLMHKGYRGLYKLAV